MRAGKLRNLVSIEAPTITQSGTGNAKPAWSTFAAALYADIDETSGREQIIAGQVNPQRPITVTIRYLAGVMPAMRVKYGTRTLQITSVVNLDQNFRTMVLTCLEKAAA